MPTPTAPQALLLFAAWALLLILGVFAYRGVRFLRGTPINHWPRGTRPADDATWAVRLADAHANCLENLPIFIAIVVAAHATQQLTRIEALAPFVVYARVGQSLAHLWGTGPAQVFVRASFWAVQLGLFAWMTLRLLGMAG